MQTRGGGVRCLEFCDIASSLPPVTPLYNDLRWPDIFLCALGFEERALTFPSQFVKQVDEGQETGRTAVHFVYSNNTAENIVNADALSSLLQRSFKNSYSLGADDPSEIRRQLTELLHTHATVDKSVSLTFDVSAASGNLIMSVMAVLAHVSAWLKLDVQIIYAEARRYYPLESDFRNKLELVLERACEVGTPSSLQEYGVADVEINELYAGLPQENQQEFVIALPAYRTERLTRCLQHLMSEPLSVVRDDVHWILGSPPIQEMAWRLELQQRIVSRLVRGFVDPSDDWEMSPSSCSVTSTLDYRETTSKVLELIDAKPAHNISVVHMGSKMQGVGLALALTARREVAVCYARPTGFNPKQYSTGVGSLSSISFPNMASVVKSIALVGTLQLVTNIETERSGLPEF